MNISNETVNASENILLLLLVLLLLNLKIIRISQDYYQPY